MTRLNDRKREMNFFCSLIEGKKDKTFERERDGRVRARRDVLTIVSSSHRKSESLCSRREEECLLRVFCACVFVRVV